MLRCSGCGGLVSEWAAHCADCGQSVDEANPYFEQMYPGAEHPEDPRRPEAEEAPAPPAPPAPKPPPGKRRPVRSAALTAVVVTVAAGATAAGLSISTGNRHGAPQGLRSLYGEVVADPAGAGQARAVAYDPATGRTAGYGPAGGAPWTPVAVSPDGTTWLESTGTIVTIAGTRMTMTSTQVADAMSGTTTPARPAPFADGDRAVVVLSRPHAGSPAEASVIRIADGARFPLGTVDLAAGDPQTLGAFVSVPARGGETVELRRPGRAPEVLATAAQLEGDVGWASTRAVKLGIYPSPTGDALAVVLTPADPPAGDVPMDVPMVVLDRDGGILAEVDDWSGPMYGRWPVWSPGAHQIAYPTYSTSGPALAIGSETGAIGTVPAPPGTRFGSCVWSLSSTDVVCQARIGSGDHWLYALPTSNRMLSSVSAGTPVAWVPTPLP